MTSGIEFSKPEGSEQGAVHADSVGSISVGRDALGNVFVTGHGNDVRVTLVVADRRLLSALHKQQFSEPVDNPYRGLDVFYETDAGFFFGRRKLVQGAWLLINQLQHGRRPRILAVIGGSGSGKSSLVRAGILPELARAPMHGFETPKVLVLRPGPAPLDRLAEVLAHLPGVGEISASTFKNSEEDGKYRSLHRILTAIPDSKGCRFVIVVDQFEELYTECTDVAARTSFLENLAFAASETDGIVSVTVTLRSDFVAAVKSPGAFVSAVRENRLVVPAMDRGELCEAIAKPAQLLGKAWPEPFVEYLASQAEGRPGALPLLQFALRHLWPQHVAGLLDEAIWASRLIEDFVVHVADTLFEAAGTEETRSADQRIIRRAFLAMVQPGEGVADTRRVADLSELVAQNEVPAHVQQVLAPFVAPEARLLTVSEQQGHPTYELTHEALISSWNRLRHWLGNVPDKADSDRIRSNLRLRRRLLSNTAEWEASNRQTELLWTPFTLERASTFLNDCAPDLTAREVDFLQASFAAKDVAIARKKRRARYLRMAILAATALIAVAGWEWRDWNRVKTTYYADYGTQWGQPYGIDPLAAATASHRSASYALDTYRGRVVALRRVNGTFNLSELSGDGIDSERWFEGTAEWRLSYSDNGQVAAITLFGATGRPIATQEFEFDRLRSTAVVLFRQAEGRPSAFANDISMLVAKEPSKPPPRSEISQHRLYFDAGGFITRRMFENGWGSPVPDSLGSFGRAYEYSTRGQVTAIRNVRKDGVTPIEKDGISEMRRNYSASGDLAAVEWRNAEGALTKRIAMQLDEYGNVTEVSSYNSKGALVREIREIWRYDKHGNKVETLHVRVDGGPVYNQGPFDNNDYDRKTSSYDERGKLIEEAYFDAKGKSILNSGLARVVLGYDARGYRAEVRYFGADGKPIVPVEPFEMFSSAGVRETCGVRETASFDAHGNVVEQASFGTDDKPCINNHGYARATASYDARDNKTEIAYYDVKGAPARFGSFYGGGYARATLRYDDRGNQVELAFYGTDGRLTLLNGVAESGYARETWRYDERGNTIETAYFGPDGKPIIPWGFFQDAVARETWAYDESGNKVEETFFGKDDQLLVVKGKGYARVRRAYDESGNETDETYFGADGKLTVPPGLAYAHKTAAYDKHSNETDEAYFGADGQPVLDKNGYARIATRYDDSDHLIAKDYFGTDGRVNNDVVSLISEGNGDLDKRRYIQAIDAFSKVLKLTPTLKGLVSSRLASAYNGNAWQLFLQNRAAEGLPDAERAVALASDNSAILDTRGQIYLALGRIDKALADLNKSIARGQTGAGTYYGRARCYEFRGNRRLAAADYQKALKAREDSDDQKREIHHKAAERLAILTGK